MIKSQTELSTVSKEDVDQVRMAFFGFTDQTAMENHLEKVRGEMEQYCRQHCAPEVAEFYIPTPLELADPPVKARPPPAWVAGFRQSQMGTIRPPAQRYRVGLSCLGSSQFEKDQSYRETLAGFEQERETRLTAQKLPDELHHSESLQDSRQG